MLNELKWQDPPKTTRGRGSTKWRDITTALMERPGEWALVMESGSVANAHALRQRFPGFEFTSRIAQRGTRLADIYARYVGEAS